jgi:dTDP-4-dehydrorhamnose reductase
MKVLLFGKDGQVGWELQRALAPLGEVLALGTRNAEFHADFAEPDGLVETVRAVRPDVIVNAAAYTAVDRAESEPDLARSINATAPGVLAQEAARSGSILVHYSTDYVFDGSGTEPRDEEAPTGPLSVYGRTKLAGEERIRQSGCTCAILRTSWVYAARGSNFARTMLRLAAEQDRLKVVDDQVGAPTSAELLADLTAHAVRMLVDNPQLGGTYHVVPTGYTSWHGYACFLIERARELGYPVKVVANRIEPVPTAEYPTPATRPLNSRLSTGKLAAAFGLTLPPWQTGVQRLLRDVLDQSEWIP